MRKFFRIAAAALIVLTAAGATWGKDGKHHIKDLDTAFGFLDAQSQKAALGVWETVQEIIDDKSRHARNSIRREFEWFVMREGDHRMLFHWGFNTRPDRFKPLDDKADKMLEKYIREKDMGQVEAALFKAEQKKLFMACFASKNGPVKRTSWETRKNALRNKITDTFGKDAGKYRDELAVIICAVHLLGDYSTPEDSALQNLNDLEHDMINSGFVPLLKGASTLDSLERRITSDFSRVRGRHYKARAEEMVNITARYLPVILSERFKDSLAKKGITVTVTEGK